MDNATRQKLYRGKVLERWEHRKAEGLHLTSQELRRLTYLELRKWIRLHRFAKSPSKDASKPEVLDFAERVYNRDPSTMRTDRISVAPCHLESREELEKFTRHALVDWIRSQRFKTKQGSAA